VERNAMLATADADTGPERRKLRRIAVAAEAEHLARQGSWRPTETLQRLVVPVKADHAMRPELVPELLLLPRSKV
jgi:hypothetical protein